MRLTEFSRQILAAALADHAMKPLQPKHKRPDQKAVVNAALAVYLSESKRVLAAASRASIPGWALNLCSRDGGSLEVRADDGSSVVLFIDRERMEGKTGLAKVVVNPKDVRGKNSATLAATAAWVQHRTATDTARVEIRRQLAKIPTLAQVRRHWQDADEVIDEAVERMKGPAPNAVPLSAVASAAFEQTKARKLYR